MDAEIATALRELGFGEARRMDALGGGVSCDVIAVDLADGRRVVVKRALPKLRVAADWRAPPERSAAEVAWIRMVARIDPGWVPRVLAEDPARHLFVMAFLPFPVWKTQLAAGMVDIGFAAEAGRRLARIHAEPASGFGNSAQFRALRIEPYLLFTADRHPDVAARIRGIAAGVAQARIAVMHGDVSPKNILAGAEGPIFLDAETACLGDPAFDLAFCLNHLLLKGVWHPEHAPALNAAFAALVEGYAPDAAMAERSAALLAALLLARVDGKSPVEYLTEDRQRDLVRACAIPLLKQAPESLEAVRAAWDRTLSTN